MEEPLTIPVPAGRAAVLTLRDVVTEAKANDPLAAVTVVVPSGFSGLSLRRLLAAGTAATSDGAEALRQTSGLVNVRFLVADRVAALLGAASLAEQGRRPLTSAVRSEALRVALGEAPGDFTPVADHPSTERLLDRAFAELRVADEPALRRLSEQGRRAGEVVRLHRAVRRRLAPTWYDDRDVLEAAVAAVAAGQPAVADLGQLVVFCPRPEDDAAQRLASAFGARAVVIDGALDSILEETPGARRLVDRIMSVADADDEARTVCREITSLVRQGVALHRIGVAYPLQAYGPLLHHHLEAAGIAHNGPAVRTLGHSVTGTALLGLLTLADHELRRDDVIGWLSSAPIIDPSTGRPAPAAAWDVDSCKAGVVVGTDQWDERLARYRDLLIEEHQRDAAMAGEVADWKLRSTERAIERVAALRAFVAHLARAVDDGNRSTWSGHSAWARNLLLAYLNPESARAPWPEVERTSWAAVLEVLDQLGRLDELAQRIDVGTFRRAVERDLTAPAAPLGPFGDGVFLAPLRAFPGVDLDAVFVVGLAEGILPGRDHDDALLPERDRLAAGPALDRVDRITEQHRSLLAALATADQHRTLLFPRADLRRGRTYLPSRWLLEAASGLAGQPVWSQDVDRLPGLTAGAVTVIASFAAGLAGQEPASLLDHDLGCLLRWQQRGGRPRDHPLADALPRLGTGLAAQDQRASTEFTAYDGNVDPGAVPALSPDRPLSPTSLEQFATCPRHHFLDRVLRVAGVDRPEEIEAISASKRGTLVHEILEDFIRTVIDGRARDVDALLALADRHFRKWEADGVTGRPLRWRYDQQLIRRELRLFAKLDSAENLTPLATEHSFGQGDEPPVRVELASGAALTFKGKADRIDRGAGGELVVTDYKTGGTSGFSTVEETTVVQGTKLQLPVYGLAARDRYGHSGQPVRARYWFVSERGQFKQYGYELTEERLDTFIGVVSVIADGITSGLFPARPGEPVTQPGASRWENCRYCEYDPICPAERAREWERKRTSLALRSYVELAEGAQEPEAGAEPEGAGDVAGLEPAGAQDESISS